MPSGGFLASQFKIHLQHVAERQVCPGRAAPPSG